MRIVVTGPDQVTSITGDPLLRDCVIAQLELQGYTVRAPAAPLPCDHIKPGTELDVLPVRCRLPKLHRDKTHWHPPLWPATPDVVWYEDTEDEAEDPRAVAQQW